MTDTSRLSNRVNRREALKSTKKRRKPDASTLRQHRIEREQAARDRTAEWIEKRSLDGMEDQQGLFMKLMQSIERHGVVWYLPIFGVLVGVVIAVLLRVAGEAIVAFEIMWRILWGVIRDVGVPESTVHEWFA